MESCVETKIIKQSSLRILRSEFSPPEIMRGLVHETPDSTTFKCQIHRLDSLIQEDISDSTLKIRSLRFRQLSHPPPNLFSGPTSPSSPLGAPSPLIQLYSSVWKVELSCPLDIRWVYHILLPALPRLTFLRFGTGCFEDFYYDYNNAEVNSYYVQRLALNYTTPKIPAYPEVRELHVSIDERKLSDFNYAFTALTGSINLILDFSIKYLKNSLTKTNLTLPSNCALDSFLYAFPRIRSKGEKIENYEKNITKFVTVSDSSEQSSASAKAAQLKRIPSAESDYSCYSPGGTERSSNPRVAVKRSSEPVNSKSKKYMEPPPTPFYTDPEPINPSKKNMSATVIKSEVPIYDVPSDSDDEVDDPRKGKVRIGIVDKSKLLSTPEDNDDDDQICTSTTPTPMVIEPPPRPPPMERRWVNDIITSIANEDDEDDSSLSSDSDEDVVQPGDEKEPAPFDLIFDEERKSTKLLVGGNNGGGGNGGRKSPSLLSGSSRRRNSKFEELYTRRN